MSHFAWSSENEIFLVQIDAEHRDLFQIAAGLENALEGKAPPPEIHNYLHALAAHLEEHFSHEEWLMQSVRYPSYGWHRQQHDTARRRLKLFVPMVEEGNPEAVDAFLEFLAGWLQDHIGVTDRMMAAFVRNYERAHSTSALERWGAPPVLRAAASHHYVPESLGPFPKTLRYCKTCGHQTTHEMRPSGLTCRNCVERSVGSELDRD
ncbi:MAG TPA: hemerythrin family protein [Bryobacteraceae bacterium]|nr:hemerythrin family protein [Bryobacteraceae bacterium]